MSLIIIGIIINIIPLASLYAQIGEDPIYTYAFFVMMVFWLISVVGAIVMSINHRIGGIMVIVGSIVFIPIGLISVIGASNLLNKKGENNLEERRKLSEKINQNT